MSGQPKKAAGWDAPVRTGLSDIVDRSGKLVLGAFGVFMIWAVLAPIDSAVVAPGSIISEGKNKQLQHLSGGTIQAIHAREGDLVEAGALIIELDPLIDQARLTRLRARNAALTAVEARLQAEKNLEPTSTDTLFSNVALRGTEDREARQASGQTGWQVTAESTGLQRSLYQEQEREFETGRMAVEAELVALYNRAAGLRRRRDGMKQKVAQLERQQSSVISQLNAARALARDGHLSRQRMWELENQLYQIESQLSDATAQAKSDEAGIAEAEAQMLQVRMTDSRQTSQKLTEVLAELAQIRDEVAAAELARSQTSIRAPVKGYLVHFTANTPGGVVASGDTVGEIVPEGNPLEVQARVALKDISSVYRDQKAEVKISALNARLYDSIQAVVTYVGSDSTTDPTTGEQYFEVRARLIADNVDSSPIVTPGMSAEVFLKGPSRTFASYLWQPFSDSLSRGFRESF